MSRARVGLSLMPQADFAAAAFPLLREASVDVLEWTVDMSPGGPGWQPPDWYRALLGHYAGAGALVGHAVQGGVVSAGDDGAFTTWLDRLTRAVSAFPIDSFSEHMGFARTRSWSRTPPLPVRPDRALLQLAIERLGRIRDALEVPVGLENLALALAPSDLDGRGALMEALLEPVDGFLHLDLHNLWCAAVNFDRDPVALMESYPLHRVRRIHLSGGSWSSVPGMDRPFRRDTHDDAVPDEVHALLPEALARCPGLRDVILEQLGGTLNEPDDFASDFRRIRSEVDAFTGPAAAPPGPVALEPLDAPNAPEDWQDALATALAGGAPWPEWPDDPDPRAMGVGRSLMGRWGRRA